MDGQDFIRSLKMHHLVLGKKFKSEEREKIPKLTKQSVIVLWMSGINKVALKDNTMFSLCLHLADRDTFSGFK